MKAHSVIPWLMGASLAGFGIVLPLAIGQNPDNEAIVYILRGLGFTGFLVGMVSLFRSSGESTVPTAVDDLEPVVPRTLCNNPLAAAHGSLPLAERIDMAAEASMAYDRSLGIVYYDLASYDRIAQGHGAASAQAAMEFVLGMIQTVLRGTDRAEPLGGGRFVVCVALLPDRDTLQQVRERIARAMTKMRVEALAGDAIEYDSGAAVYPLHAKSGADLIAHARQDCEMSRQRRRRARPAPRETLAAQGCAA